jgi:hypothetical protein
MARVHYYTFALLSALALSACVDEDEIVSPREEGKTAPSVSLSLAALLATSPQNGDQDFIATAQVVPGFGGMYIDENAIPTVYLVDTAQAPAAQADVDFLLDGYHRIIGDGRVARREIRVLQGDYDFLQLSEWEQRARRLLGTYGVLSTDVDEVKNRVALGIEADDMRSQVESGLRRLNIPLAAVVIELSPPGGPGTTLSDRVRHRGWTKDPVRGGRVHLGLQCVQGRLRLRLRHGWALQRVRNIWRGLGRLY